MFRTEPPASMRLDEDGVHRTVIHPLATSVKNETSSKDLRDGLIDFLEQIGQTLNDHHPRIIFVGGDGLTFEQLGNLKWMTQFQDGPFKNFEIIQPYLQLWHTEWTDLSRLFVAHFGMDKSEDPSTIGHSSAKIGFKWPANLAKIDYYPGSHHLYRVLDARILDCWRCGRHVHFLDAAIDPCFSLYFKADSVWTYFDNLHEDDFPSPEKLFQTALSLYDNYSNPKASAIFMTGCQTSSVVLVGEPWTEEEDVEPGVVPMEADNTDVKQGEGEDELGEDGEKKSPRKDTVLTEDEREGDHTLARSTLFMYEALVSKEVAQAVAEGDIGRVYEGIKVSCQPNLGLRSLTVR
jgi:hypothetical protein